LGEGRDEGTDGLHVKGVLAGLARGKGHTCPAGIAHDEALSLGKIYRLAYFKVRKGLPSLIYTYPPIIV
jgi:hypothetical protein